MASLVCTGGDDTDLFREAVSGVTPLGDRQRVGAPKSADKARRSASAAATSPPASAKSELAVERAGDEIRARSAGVNRRQLADLRKLTFSRAETLDLHGLGAAAARDRLRAFVAKAAAAGTRHLLVITGKGRRSEAGPVLRDLAVAELSGPLAQHVAGFTSASRRQGGTGALCLLLRRT